MNSDFSWLKAWEVSGLFRGSDLMEAEGIGRIWVARTCRVPSPKLPLCCVDLWHRCGSGEFQESTGQDPGAASEAVKRTVFSE